MAMCAALVLGGLSVSSGSGATPEIPLPEHPRPDFQREQWVNLNGRWAFRFDKENVGLDENWFGREQQFPQRITVPFSWGSKLSGVEDEADIGWYRRVITVPEEWDGSRVFLVIGASDWHTTAWLDGVPLGEHRGGYTPFSLDLTPAVKFGRKQRLVIRVDDTPHPFKLEGKQGYGRAAGIWQTAYLEVRPAVALETVHFTPDIHGKKVDVEVMLDGPAAEGASFELLFLESDRSEPRVVQEITAGQDRLEFSVPLEQVRLWSLDDPYLYEVKAVLNSANAGSDSVSTYFGMREISVGNLPGTEIPYVFLNGEPIYLQLALDQSYHPDGYYTFPSDEFMRDEILRSRRIGLNGQRIHIKVEVPRKLYWADRLGILIQADVPNSWGQPDAAMRAETEYALRGMVKRDYNHPAIFSWVNFNETWGLRTGDLGYTPETQEWVESIYHLTKELDGTRLVEDNSPCNYDHVATDINTWHAYLPGYGWRERLDQICADTYPGSTWNFIGGRKQGNQPMFNSECGNVWGYEGSAGDVDWSWDYHIMMNEFRRHPKVAGWLYTEHHDVINEWNGYWRFDRTEKYTGMEDLAPGMTLRDLHSPFYIATERELCRQVAPGEVVDVPVYASFMTGADVGEDLVLEMALERTNRLGESAVVWTGAREIEFEPWMSRELDPMPVPMPDQPGVAVLSLALKDSAGRVLHRNFTTYVVGELDAPRDETGTIGDEEVRMVRFAPDTFTSADWTLKQWDVLDGLKVNGAGAGYFEYEIDWPEGLTPDQVETAALMMELSAKQLFGKDVEGAAKQEGDFMRGKGTHDPSLNRNAYPMTDEYTFPSAVQIRVMGEAVGIVDLPDDSADHRGVLSWYSQKRDRFLREAGSYGWLVKANVSEAALNDAYKAGKLKIRLEVDESLAHGVAIYGERFGRYPLDPTLVFVLED
jgi:hypothetical protein